MNCQEFKIIVNDLSGNALIDSELRQKGLSHAALCSNCATLLSKAAAVQGSLRLAAAAETESAPAHVKQSLLAAFAERNPGAAPVVEISSYRKRNWLAVAALAAAAAILLAVILPSFLKRQLPVAPAPQSAKSIESKAPAPSPAETPKHEQTPVAGTNDHLAAVPDSVPNSVRKRESRVARPVARIVKNEGAVTASNRKKTNEYLPLTYLASSTAMESGTVVRVQLSRATLASLGLPVSVEGSDTLIKADLVMGDDGVARAIRLVN